jgi:hypothetical protein
MNRAARLIVSWVMSVGLAGALVVAAGCESTEVKRPQQALVHAPDRVTADADIQAPAPVSRAERRASPLSDATDPCAGRLHDLCGILLQFYQVNHRLPANDQELSRAASLDPTLELTCPVSGRAYVYNPVGIMTVDKQPRLILYDAAPSHRGYRWAIGIIEPQEEDGPLITKVVALPESTFTVKPPAGR